ncbi:MAG: hypothetical protein ABW200_02845 [Hyphomicrobiaceae bacterium]|jgi:hypothetical protein
MKLRTMLGGSLMIALGALALVAFCGSDAAQAGGDRKRATARADADYSKGRYYRKRTRVYGYTARRGGYSYWPEDVINTYGMSRSLYGSMNTYRDPTLDRQSPGGPFDHGFFFDSGIGPQGGQSPYLH